jgi:hypothetical protein
MSSVTTPTPETLCDATDELLHEASTDRAVNIVRNVVLLGPRSRNGYRYTLEAMRQAAPLYDGRPVFVDHAELQPTQRKLRDFAGHVLQPRCEGDRLRADLKLVGPNRDWLLDLIEAAPRDVGISHVVLARRSPAGNEVAHIDKVVSVDIVAFPATTQSFRENVATPIHDRAAQVRHVLQHVNLPPHAVTPHFINLLLMADDPEALCLEFVQALRHAVQDTPHLPDKPPPGSTPGTDPRAAVIAAITGRS